METKFIVPKSPHFGTYKSIPLYEKTLLYCRFLSTQTCGVFHFTLLYICFCRDGKRLAESLNGEIMKNKFITKINLFLLFSMMFAVGAAQQVSAATWTVTKIADTDDNVCNADCSLREAVAASQNSDVINFHPNLAGTQITLTGSISISKSITINGNKKIRISGNDTVRIFGIGGNASVKMNNLDLGNAYINNQPSPWTGVGGAIFVVYASLELDNCYIHNSSSYSSGAGIAVVDSVLVVNNSLIAANKANAGGGGIFAHSSRVKIDNTRFNLNSAAASGGGLAIMGGTLEMTDSSVYKSSSGTGGGAMYLYGDDTSVFTVKDSAIHNNNSKTAGGVYLTGGKMNLINSTLSNNQATAGSGGGLVSDGDAFLRNVTVTMNKASGDAGGVDSISGDVNFGNTVIAGNLSGNNYSRDIKGIFTSAGYNVVGQFDNAFLFGDLTGVQFSVADPMLNPLTYNGSQTLNHLPKPGSPVINTGSTTLAVDESNNPLLFDQRGFGRINGFTVDIGAVETLN